jgi:hypothetical protein
MRENVKWSVKYSTDPLSIKLLYLQANFGGKSPPFQELSNMFEKRSKFVIF